MLSFNQQTLLKNPKDISPKQDAYVNLQNTIRLYSSMIAAFMKPDIYTRIGITGYKTKLDLVKIGSIAHGFYKFSIVVKGDRDSGRATYINSLVGDRLIPSLYEGPRMSMTWVQYDDRYELPELFETNLESSYDRAAYDNYFYTDDKKLTPLGIRGAQEIHDYLEKENKSKRASISNPEKFTPYQFYNYNIQRSVDTNREVLLEKFFVIKMRMKHLESMTDIQVLRRLQFIDLPSLEACDLDYVAKFNEIMKSGKHIMMIKAVDMQKYSNTEAIEYWNWVMVNPDRHRVFFNKCDLIKLNDLNIREEHLVKKYAERNQDYGKAKAQSIAPEAVLINVNDRCEILYRTFCDTCEAFLKPNPIQWTTFLATHPYSISFGSAKASLKSLMMHKYLNERSPFIRQLIAQNFTRYVITSPDTGFFKAIKEAFSDDMAVMNKHIAQSFEQIRENEYSEAITVNLMLTVSAHMYRLMDWANSRFPEITDEYLKLEMKPLPTQVIQGSDQFQRLTPRKFILDITQHVMELYHDYAIEMTNIHVKYLSRVKDIFDTRGIPISNKKHDARKLLETFVYQIVEVSEDIQQSLDEIFQEFPEDYKTHTEIESALLDQELKNILLFPELRFQIETLALANEVSNSVSDSIKSFTEVCETNGVDIDVVGGIHRINKISRVAWMNQEMFRRRLNGEVRDFMYQPWKNEAMKSRTEGEEIMDFSHKYALGAIDVYSTIKRKKELGKKSGPRILEELGNFSQINSELCTIYRVDYQVTMMKVVNDTEFFIKEYLNKRKLAEPAKISSEVMKSLQRTTVPLQEMI